MLRLFDEDVAEEGVAGEIATQHGVEGDAGASGQAGLREQCRWDAGGASLAVLDYGDGVLEGRGKGTVQAVQVGGIGDLAGVRDRVGAGGDGRFKLREPPAQAGCKRGASFVEGPYGCRCSAGPPRVPAVAREPLASGCAPRLLTRSP